MAVRHEMEPGDGRVVLVVTAHADDAALFLGGTILRWADAGWRVVLVRVTDDRWDSVGLDEATTIEANRRELRRAASLLGVTEVVDLDWPTDVLGDASEVALREHMIRLVRLHRPYALVTFDPYAMYGEDNQDHRLVAAAVDEAFWTAQFDKHHPEHGLPPHGAFERWYFGRQVVDVTTFVDIGDVLERKLAAALAHETPLRNLVHQLRLQAATGGWAVDALDAAQDGDLAVVLGPLLQAGWRLVGARHRLEAAEEFRVVRFGGLEALLDRLGRRL